MFLPECDSEPESLSLITISEYYTNFTNIGCVVVNNHV